MNFPASSTMDPEALEQQIESLKQQLEDAEELRHAITMGSVDAFVVGESEDSKRVLLLSGAYARYRQLVEEMQQGALTMSRSGEIMFSNHAFAELIGVRPIDLFRVPLHSYLAPSDRPKLDGLLAPRPGQSEVTATLRARDGAERRVRMSLVSVNDDFITLLVTPLSHDEEVAGATVEAIRNGSVDALVVGGDQVVISGQSCDPAGNCATGQYTLSIDRTDPTITATTSQDTASPTYWVGTTIVRPWSRSVRK